MNENRLSVDMGFVPLFCFMSGRVWFACAPDLDALVTVDISPHRYQWGVRISPKCLHNFSGLNGDHVGKGVLIFGQTYLRGSVRKAFVFKTTHYGPSRTSLPNRIPESLQHIYHPVSQLLSREKCVAM